MQIVAELHTHTNVSTHAYNSITEMCKRAYEVGLKVIAITNHGPSLPDSPIIWHFEGFKNVPRIAEGVCVLSGVELNITSYDGDVDLDEKHLEMLDFRIASIHTPPNNVKGTIDEYTQEYLKALENRGIDCFGHMQNPRFKFHHEPVVKDIAQAGRVIEVNESWLWGHRADSNDALIDILKLSKASEGYVAVTTDSHSIYTLGQTAHAVKLLEELEYPEPLIINSSMERLSSFITGRRGRNLLLEPRCRTELNE
jgi:putative hydrolase